MTRICFNSENITGKVKPSLNSAVTKLNSALATSQNLTFSNTYYYNNYLKNVSSLISKERDRLNKVLKWLDDSVSTYRVFEEEHVPYIDKCLVEEVQIKTEKIKLNY